MKISNDGIEKLLRHYVGQVETNKASGKGSKDGRSKDIRSCGPDELILSEGAREIWTLKKELGRLPQVREDRVSDIASRLKDGTYKVAGSEVAKKILEGLRKR